MASESWGKNRSRFTAGQGLVLVWACFLARGLFYSATLPVWEGFDEYSHFAYIEHLAQTGQLPVARTPVSREVEESLTLVPLPWLLRDMNLPHATHDEYWRLPGAERERRQEQLYSLPRAWEVQPGTRNVLIYEAQQPPLYYFLLSLPLRMVRGLSLPCRLMLMRSLSVILASLAIPAAFLVARSVLRSHEAALGIASLMALLPGLMVDVCRVGNDSLGVVLYTCLVLATLRFIESPQKRGAALLLTLSLGAGLLTKAYFLPAVPGLGVILISCFYRRDRWKALARGLACLLMALTVSGWWYWRNHVLTGSFSGLMQDVALHRMTLAELLRTAPRVDWRNALDSTFLSHIWFGNWSFLVVRSWMYHAFRFAGLLAVLGILISAGKAWSRRAAMPEPVPSLRHLVVLCSFCAFMCIGICYHVLITFAAYGQSSSAGWYLYSLIAVELLLVITGLQTLSPAVLRPWITPAAAISFGLLDTYTVHFLLIPYYTGMIAHKANGALATFLMSRVPEVGFWDIVARMQANKPFLTSPAVLVIWLCYLAATLILMAWTLRLGFPQRTMR